MSIAASRPTSAPLNTPASWKRLTSRSHFHHSLEPNAETYLDEDRGLRLAWDSRSQRKGIPAVPIVGKSDEEKGGGKDGTKEAQWTVKRRRMRFVGFDWWDISWWVAILFVRAPFRFFMGRVKLMLEPVKTVGSVFWCINGILFFVFFDRVSLGYTNTESATAFLGGTLFIFGAYLGWVESLNPARDADFGWEIDEVAKTLTEPEHDLHALGKGRHHFGAHQTSANSSTPEDAGKPTSADVARTVSNSSSTLNPAAPKWKWYGTYPSLAYIANTVQLFGELANALFGCRQGLTQFAPEGASIFWVSTLCGLPGILPASGSSGGPEQSAASEGLWVVLYWGFQVIGAPCFVFAGACFCIEVQDKWWKPKPLNIGWQIGFWNLIGGFGFWFCGIFGIWRQTSISNPELYQKWGAAFSTFWGSWAFLIGSYIQLWEGINKRQ